VNSGTGSLARRERRLRQRAQRQIPVEASGRCITVNELALEELEREQDADNPHVRDMPANRALNQSTHGSRFELTTIERRLVDKEPEKRPAFASEVGRIASEAADRCQLRPHAMPKRSKACGDFHSYLRCSRRRAVVRRREARKLRMCPQKESLQETVTAKFDGNSTGEIDERVVSERISGRKMIRKQRR
jgi:hypothetical protein